LELRSYAKSNLIIPIISKLINDFVGHGIFQMALYRANPVCINKTNINEEPTHFQSMSIASLVKDQRFGK